MLRKLPTSAHYVPHYPLTLLYDFTWPTTSQSQSFFDKTPVTVHNWIYAGKEISQLDLLHGWLLRATLSLTNVCRSSLPAQVLDFFLLGPGGFQVFTHLSVCALSLTWEHDNYKGKWLNLSDLGMTLKWRLCKSLAWSQAVLLKFGNLQ